jgi:hypothetical protein
MYKVCKHCDNTRILISEDDPAIISTLNFNNSDNTYMYRAMDPNLVFDLTLPRIRTQCCNPSCLLQHLDEIIGRSFMLLKLVESKEKHVWLQKQCEEQVQGGAYFQIFQHYGVFTEIVSGLDCISKIISLPSTATREDLCELVFEKECCAYADVVGWKSDKETKSFVFICTVCGVQTELANFSNAK